LASAATSYSSTTEGPAFSFFGSSTIGIRVIWWDFPLSQALFWPGSECR
jgi:hypothetical protein